MRIKAKTGATTGKNPIPNCLIKAMEKPPHLTDEDIEMLLQSIEEGKILINFDSPFESDGRGKEWISARLGEIHNLAFHATR